MLFKSAVNLLVLIILFVTGCGGLLDPAGSSNKNILSSSDFKQIKSEIDSIALDIEEEHCVGVYYAKRPVFGWWAYSYTLAPKADYSKVLDCLKLLQGELAKYPEGFLKRAEVKHIVVAKKLYIGGRRVCAFAVPRHKTVYLNYGSGKYGATAGRGMVIHHELYHMIESKFNGNSRYKDSAWTGFNDSEFRYEDAGGSFDTTESEQEMPYHPEDGFVSRGARSAPWQDKAEVYGFLFADELNECLHGWIEEDEILRNKVSYMKDFLLKCCDEMDHDFWENLRTGQCTMPPDLGGFLQEEIDSRFCSVPDDDSVVELIAVTRNTGENRKWWRPNGEQFEEPPFRIIESEAGSEDGLSEFRFFIRIKTGLPYQQLQYAWRLREAQYIGRVQSAALNKDGWTLPDVFEVTGYLPDDTESCQLAVGLTLDEWTTGVSYNPKTRKTSGSVHGVVFNKPFMKKGNLEIEISHDIATMSETVRTVVAVDFTGMDHYPVCISTRVIEQQVKFSFIFEKLKHAKVRQFHLRTCPYTWISFDGISLRPGRISNVQVEKANN